MNVQEQAAPNAGGAQTTSEQGSFYERAGVRLSTIPVGPGVPFGVERVANPQVGIGGAYGTWGTSYDNETLPGLIAERLGETVGEKERMNLAELGFIYRQHTSGLSLEEEKAVELEVGARMLGEAIAANGWQPEEVEAVLIGSSSPPTPDFTELIARKAGIREEALKVSIHKACDGSVGGLHLALNPQLDPQLARSLEGKKVLVGGIEGLSRLLHSSHDLNAYQLFGNGAGVIGLIPGQSMRFLVGKSYEVFDDEGVLQVRMDYPYPRGRDETGSQVEISQASAHHLRFAGRMHEPADGSGVVMAGPMGMVKLFVRTGVQVVSELYQTYQARMAELNRSGRAITLTIVHHANYKINKLIEKNLQKDGIVLNMPWLLSEFGNVSAASNMIAFLRSLRSLKPGDILLFDGFGAGTYYDALAVELGGK